MKINVQAFAGASVAIVFALVAVFGATGTTPLLANFALATYGGGAYGGGDDVTICSQSETITVEAGELASFIANGAQLGACSDDAGQLTIGKVYLEGASDTQSWVELYNPSNQTVSLSGWEICNANSCDSLGGASVAPGEYVLIAGNGSIHTEISIPWGVELVLVNDGAIGGGLNTSADIIKLRGSDGIIVDQMNWGTPNTAWPNYNEAAWSGLGSQAGSVIARDSITTDTDTSSDWGTAGVPTVSLSVPSPLVAGQDVSLGWKATNPNGAVSDLNVDLYWFEEDDTLHLIELGADNTGSYDWTLPDYEGDIRVKIVVTSPSNPLLNARDLSDFATITPVI